MIVNLSKKKCVCGYETEFRCRVHPARPAHSSYGRDVNGPIWLCHDCERLLTADPAYNLGYGRDREYTVARFLERSFVICPCCVHDAALYEDAERELEIFLTQDVA